MPTSGKVYWTGWVISILSILIFILSVIFKFIEGPETVKGFAHLGFPMKMAIPIGILELSVVVIYLIPQTAVLGAILMTGYVGGTIITVWRVGDPFYLNIALGILIWLGIYLREDRLWPLIP